MNESESKEGGGQHQKPKRRRTAKTSNKQPAKSAKNTKKKGKKQWLDKSKIETQDQSCMQTTRQSIWKGAASKPNNNATTGSNITRSNLLEPTKTIQHQGDTQNAAKKQKKKRRKKKQNREKQSIVGDGATNVSVARTSKGDVPNATAKAKMKSDTKKKKKDTNNPAVSFQRKQQKKEQKERAALDVDLSRGGYLLPHVNILLVFGGIKTTLFDGLPESTLLAQSSFQVEQYWALEKLRREMIEKSVASKQGRRHEMRQDHTWDDFAMQPPLILTHHAKLRLAERGPCCIPKFVDGTRRSVVATYIPAERWQVLEDRGKERRKQRRADKHNRKKAKRDKVLAKMKVKAMKKRRDEKRKTSRESARRSVRWLKIARRDVAGRTIRHESSMRSEKWKGKVTQSWNVRAAESTNRQRSRSARAKAATQTVSVHKKPQRTVKKRKPNQLDDAVEQEAITSSPSVGLRDLNRLSKTNRNVYQLEWL